MPETDKKQKPPVENKPQPPKVKAVSQKRSSFGVIIALIALLVALIALAASVYQGVAQTVKVSQLGGATQQTSQLLADNKAIAKKISVLEGTVSGQQQLAKDNQAAIAKVVYGANNGQRGWLFSEAEYLLKLANITLQFEHNIPVTIELLKSANQRLFDMGNPALYSVRAILAKDIVKLQSLPKLDVAGIYLRLQALREVAVNLPLATSKFTGEKKGNVIAGLKSDKTDAWHRALNATSDVLSKVLVVRRHDQQIQPLVSINKNRILRQNIYLLFSQAQWALLNRQNTIYQQSFLQLKKLINQYYADNQQSAAIMRALSQLQKTNVAPNIPSISNALNALTQYENKKAKQVLMDGKKGRQNSSAVIPVKLGIQKTK